MRRHARDTAKVVGVLMLGVLSTGCLRAYQDLTLNEDDTVDGTIVFAVDQQLLELSGQSLDGFMEEVTGDNAGIPEGIEFTQEPYEEDGFVGQRFTFSGAPLQEFGGAGTAEELSISREGETFVVNGSFDASDDAELDPSTMPVGQEVLENFDVQVSVTFPGEVTSHNGELDGSTVRWRLQLGEVNEIQAVGSAIGSGGSGGGVLVWVLLAVAVLAGGALIGLLISSRRKSDGAGGGEPGHDEAAFATTPTSPAATEAGTDTPPPSPPPAPVPVVAPTPQPPPTPAPPGAGDGAPTAGPAGGDPAPG